MRLPHLCALTLAALFGMASAACTPLALPREPAPVSAASAPHPPTAAASFPRGRFSALAEPATVLLAIETDGSFELYMADDLQDKGRFDAAGEQLVMVDSARCAARGAKPASYTWVYTGKQVLVFRPTASDGCPERTQYLAQQYLPQYLLAFEIPDRGPSREWLW